MALSWPGSTRAPRARNRLTGPLHGPPALGHVPPGSRPGRRADSECLLTDAMTTRSRPPPLGPAHAHPMTRRTRRTHPLAWPTRCTSPGPHPVGSASRSRPLGWAGPRTRGLPRTTWRPLLTVLHPVPGRPPRHCPDSDGTDCTSPPPRVRPTATAQMEHGPPVRPGPPPVARLGRLAPTASWHEWRAPPLAQLYNVPDGT